MKTKTRSVIVKIKTGGKSYCSKHCPFNQEHSAYCVLFNDYTKDSKKYNNKYLRLAECKDAETIDCTDS